MVSKAKVTLVGNMGRDAETRYTPNGKMNVAFSMATSEKYNDVETTTWWNVTAWGRLAEILDGLSAKGAMGKGTLVLVEGNPKQREYQKDGQTRQSLDVNAQDVLILRAPNQQGGGNQQQAYVGGIDDVPF